MSTVRVISNDELSKHSNNKDCWIAIHGVVIDITQFLNEHPGGPDVIVTVSGRDCTHEFEDIGHTDSARRAGDKYIVGRLEGHHEDVSSFQELHILTNKEVIQMRSQSGLNRGGIAGYSLVGLGTTVVGLVALYYAFISNRQ
jgi:cytochrome b involved in lipid metabolism